MSIAIANEPSGDRWFVVQTRTRGEDTALRHMRNQGFAAFCPRARIRRQIGRHWVERLEPFFPRYMFVLLDLERQPWRSINGTVGVTRLVSFGAGARPSPVPAGFVEQLQQLAATGDEVRFADRLAPGEHVRVMAGPFADLCGVLETAGHDERVTVLLDVLARETRVEMSRALVARAA